jgi:hypothetical protein
VIVTTMGVFSLLGMFLIAMFIAGAMLRDYELGTADLFFASPVKARDYLLGRFVAGSIGLPADLPRGRAGMMLGQAMPWIDPQRLGPFSLQPYAWALGCHRDPEPVVRRRTAGLAGGADPQRCWRSTSACWPFSCCGSWPVH